MQKVKTFNQAKRWVSEIKFSPDNSKCVIGDHYAQIYLYNCLGKGKKFFKKRKLPKKHSSSITHMDWTADGENL